MNPTQWEEYEKKLDDIIARNGWAVQSVGIGEMSPPFSYSIGMTEALGCPEFLIIGVGYETGMAVINGLGASLKSKEKIPLDDWAKIDKVIQGFPVVFRDIPWQVRDGWTAFLDRKYPEKRDVRQIVLPDATGKFPWEDGADPVFSEHQRHLIVKADEFRRLN